MGENESVIIDVPKPRSFAKGTKEIPRKLHKTKWLEENCVLPAFKIIKPLAVAQLKKEDILLPYLRYLKQQEKTRFKEKLKTSIRQEYKYAYTELRKRLDTKGPENDCHSVTNYDPTFYTCVESRVTSNYVASYKSLKYCLNSHLRWKQEIGYRHDCILNIETNYKKERNIYDKTVKRYKKEVKNLDDFISDDYKKSMSFLGEWEAIKTKVNEKSSELEYLAAEIFTLSSKILGLDYKYGLQQKYGRFLYYLSPPSWRLEKRYFARSVEIEAKGFGFGISSDDDTFSVIFENLKRECDDGFVKPALYFQTPNELLEIFDGIEQQQLHHFMHVTRLAPLAKILNNGIKLFKDIIRQDSAGLLNVIKELEKMLKFCEERCLQLEAQFYKILNGLFYESVAATEVLQLKCHLEFCYSKLYREKPMNIDITGTAKALEKFYMDYSQRIESLTSDEVKSAIKRCVALERRKFKRAEWATKELRLFERLERALLRAYAPPLPVNQRGIFKSKNLSPSTQKTA